ncbi:MAG: phosphotransferase, partial [Bacteroidales bacterium]
MMSYNESPLKILAERYYQSPCQKIEKIPQSGSSRLYFRMFFEHKPTIIGVYNQDIAENRAFFSFTDFFRTQQIHVPNLLAIDETKRYYLLSDLGNETLYSFLTEHRNGEQISPTVLEYYHKVIDQLPLIQLSGKKGIDFSVSYPRFAFDRQSMQWDLNYFKYFFLKLSETHFDEQLLENDFNTLMDYLLEVDSDYFLFRDFQSRNIMIQEGEVYFIDYQGGRKGALQYDIASLLYDGKADIPPVIREQLLDYYITQLEKYIPVNRQDFIRHYEGFVLIRIMQAMGTYGYRGYFERKSHFLLSIPYAVRNIKYLLERSRLPIEIPTLLDVLQQVTESDFVKSYEQVKKSEEKGKLRVLVQSFAYKKGIPSDPSAN